MSEERSDEDDDVNGLGCGCLLVPGGTAIRRLCKWHEATTFPKTWAGFRAFLDEMYPDDIFPDDGRDLGPSFVVAARRLSKVENDLAGLRGVVQALEAPEAIEAAAMALYEDTRDPGYDTAEWDWPNIDRSYDKPDEDETDPEWLRNLYRREARVAIRAALAAAADAPQPTWDGKTQPPHPDWPRPPRPQLNPLAKRERGTVALDGSAGPPTCEHGSTGPHRYFVDADPFDCPGPSPAVLPQTPEDQR